MAQPTPQTIKESAPKWQRSIFKDLNLDSNQAYAFASKFWQGVPPGTPWWGVKNAKMGAGLDPENFQREVVDAFAKRLAKYGEETLRKTLTLTGATVFVPTIIDPKVVDILRRETPFTAFVPKYTTYTTTSKVNVRTGRTSPAFYSGDQTAEFTPSPSTYKAVDIDVKFLYNPDAVVLPAIAGSQLTTDIYAQEIQASFIDLMRTKEEAQLRARKATGAETWGGFLTADANAWDGVFKALFNFDAAESMDHYVELPSGASISIAHMEQIIEKVETQGAMVDAFFCDLATFNQLRGQARLQQRLSQGDLSIGAPRRRFFFDDIPVIATTQLPVTSGQRALIGLSLEAVRSDILIPETLREVAQNMKPVKEFFWMAYEAFTLVSGWWAAGFVGGT